MVMLAAMMVRKRAKMVAATMVEVLVPASLGRAVEVGVVLGFEDSGAPSTGVGAMMGGGETEIGALPDRRSVRPGKRSYRPLMVVDVFLLRWAVIQLAGGEEWWRKEREDGTTETLSTPGFAYEGEKSKRRIRNNNEIRLCETLSKLRHESHSKSKLYGPFQGAGDDNMQKESQPRNSQTSPASQYINEILDTGRETRYKKRARRKDWASG
jgi:hypothetical protein